MSGAGWMHAVLAARLCVLQALTVGSGIGAGLDEGPQGFDVPRVAVDYKEEPR